MDINNDISRVLFTQEQLKAVCKRLGKQITEDYQGKNLIMVGVLKGSFMFIADLIREVSVPCAVDFMAVSSYGSGSKSSGVVQIIKDLGGPIEGKDILLVEDILDSGRTLNYIISTLKTRNPSSIKICALFNKPERREADIDLDYEGMLVPNEFIVGYGLDYNQNYRGLPYIGVLKPEIYEGK